jgi:hypothetical protein
VTNSNPLTDSAAADVQDENLVTRAHSGEREALEALVRRHQDLQHRRPHALPSAGRGRRDPGDPDQGAHALGVQPEPQWLAAGLAAWSDAIVFSESCSSVSTCFATTR